MNSALPTAGLGAGTGCGRANVFGLLVGRRLVAHLGDLVEVGETVLKLNGADIIDICVLHALGEFGENFIASIWPPSDVARGGSLGAWPSCP